MNCFRNKQYSPTEDEMLELRDRDYEIVSSPTSSPIFEEVKIASKSKTRLEDRIVFEELDKDSDDALVKVLELLSVYRILKKEDMYRPLYYQLTKFFGLYKSVYSVEMSIDHKRYFILNMQRYLEKEHSKCFIRSLSVVFDMCLIYYNKKLETELETEIEKDINYLTESSRELLNIILYSFYIVQAHVYDSPLSRHTWKYLSTKSNFYFPEFLTEVFRYYKEIDYYIGFMVEFEDKELM